MHDGTQTRGWRPCGATSAHRSGNSGYLPSVTGAVIAIGLTLQAGVMLSTWNGWNEASTTTLSKSAVATAADELEPAGICSHILRPPPSPSGPATLSSSASEIWTANIDRIWSVSQNPRAPQYTNATELYGILRGTLAPGRLRRGVLSRPFGAAQAAALRNAAAVAERRMADSSAPPLRVAVLGGSVTVGRGCEPGSRLLANHECAWPRRFETLVNGLAGTDLVRVYNLAYGGTSTEQGNVFVKYWMYNDDELNRHGPDVIINSYSTNDALPPYWMKDAKQITEHVRGRTHDALQEFVRIALRSKGPCAVPPLVVHVDDYVGNQNPSILGDLSYLQAMSQVARWYGTTAVSYPEVVRDIVYKDTDETVFSAPWRRTRGGEYKVDVHFPLTGHATIAWTLAYAALEIMNDYCHDIRHERLRQKKRMQNTGEEEGPSSFPLAGVEALPAPIPPPLSDDLKMEHVSRMWNGRGGDGNDNNATDRVVCADANRDDGADDASDKSNSNNPCVLAFVAGPTGLKEEGRLKNFMRPYLAENEGWDSQANPKDGWKNKVGWEALKPNATFTMRLKDLPKDVGAVTIMYMKSYGEKWDHSTASFTVLHTGSGGDTKGGGGGDEAEGRGAGVVVAQRNLTGYHDSRTSVLYAERIELSANPAPRGADLKLRVDLVGGTTFKILGMMFCSW